MLFTVLFYSFICSFWMQATLNLVMDVLLSEENGWVDLQQEVGRLVNVIVSVIGPELSPQGIFFSRCKVSKSKLDVSLIIMCNYSSSTAQFKFLAFPSLGCSCIWSNTPYLRCHFWDSYLIHSQKKTQG